MMYALVDLLPPAKSHSVSCYDHSNDAWFKRLTSGETEKAAAVKAKPVPPYLNRAGFIPRRVEDFGDGGAFPEIHVAQCPLDMGRDRSGKAGPKILPVTVDSRGNIAYDAIVKQNENKNKIVYSQHEDIIPKILKNAEDEEEIIDEMEIEEVTQQTKAALEKIVNERLAAAQPSNVPAQSSDSQFIKYKPSQQSASFNSGAKERIIRMVQMPVDPLEPPKPFKHKQVPAASGPPPVPVMHSPPRPVTVKDQKDWSIPPCISNWKNPKGYTIPLDKRLAADGRGLQEVQINDNFAKLSEAFYVAEQKAREAVALRSKAQKEMMMKEKEMKEQELKALAQRARAERTGIAPPPAPDSDRSMTDGRSVGIEHIHARERDVDYKRELVEDEEGKLRRERHQIRKERQRERERERRLEAKHAPAGKKRKTTRDRERDVSEKAALGMASAAAGKGGEVMYDQRLFNQDKGMGSGFGSDDQYNVYDKGLFTGQSVMSTLYNPKSSKDSDVYVDADADKELDKLKNTSRFKPDKAFGGANERARPRSGPVEFEKDVEEADPFGLDQFLTEVKKGKDAMDKVGSGGTMRAGGSSRDDVGGSGRTRVNFEGAGARLSSLLNKKAAGILEGQVTHI